MHDVSLIVAIGPDGVTGRGNELAWHSKLDFHHFKTVTKGKPCIFGDVTFYNLPKYPLKNRLSVVVNINRDNTAVLTNESNGSWIETNSIEKALEYTANYDEVFICGGMSVYKYCLDNGLINTVYLTTISSPSLEKQIKENPKDYKYFPINLKNYLEDWTYFGSIDYSNDHIKENNDISCIIQKWHKFSKA